MTRLFRVTVGAVVVGAAVSCASAAPSPPRRTPATPTESVPAASVLQDLAMLAVGTVLSRDEIRESQERMRLGETTLDAFVRGLLDDPRFSRDVAPEIVINKRAVDLSEEVPWESLKLLPAPASPGRGVYFLRTPCDARAAVPVHPWWALDTEVLVCPDSYQPEHLRDPRTGWYCGGDNLDPERNAYCGCGPNLMNCARDEENSLEIRRGLRQEVTKTIAHAVAQDWPLAKVFTTNETVRTGFSEFFYERWRVMKGELRAISDLRAWPSEGKLAARHESSPGQHAGILTTPHILLYGDTPRARMRNAYNDLWCSTPSSVNVTTEQVLALGVTDLRDGAGWQKLASMPVCTDCHARLDYGMQFFAGYPSSFVGLVFDPALAARGRGALYGDGIADRRGDAELAPRGFADLATAQREFATCMAKDVADHVFNATATPEDERALAAAFRARGTLKSLMREALLRYARRERQASPVAAPAGDLRALLGTHCAKCHSSGAKAFVADSAPSPPLLDEMLADVAFHRMPKAPDTMRARERSALVRALIGARWPDEARRAEATRYFDGGMRTLPPHRGSALLRFLESRAGARDEEAASWTFSDADRHDAVRYGTSFIATFALAALRSCKAAGLGDAALEECLGRALDVEASSKK